MKRILNVSFDIEADGNNPLLHNMISIGMYGIDDNGTEIFTYEANIENLPGHHPQQICMETFWNQPEQKTAWEYMQQNKKCYSQVCEELSNIFKKFSSEPYNYRIEFVAHPANFDWMFFKCYYSLAKSKDESLYDIGYSCKCSSTLWSMYKKKMKLSSIEADILYKQLSDFDPTKEHFALEDARCQGIAYVKIKKLFV